MNTISVLFKARPVRSEVTCRLTSCLTKARSGQQEPATTVHTREKWTGHVPA